MTERLTAWTWRRQRLDGSAPDGLGALRDVIAVYSAHPSGPLALLARDRGLDVPAFARLEADRAAIRVVAMRGSSFLVPAFTADRLVAATARPVATPGMLRARGLDRPTYERLKPAILEACATPVTPTQLRRALGVADDDTRPYFAMRVMAREGLVLRVGAGRVRTDDLRWVATEAWLGRPLAGADPEASLRWLAGAYLEAFGPARPGDFAWWAGVPAWRAAAAMEAHETVEVEGGRLPVELHGAWRRTRALAADAVAVLPKWDPMAMGYAPDGRGRFLDDAHLSLAYSTAETRVGATTGDALPLVLVRGMAVATWSHRLSGDRLTIEVRPFPGPADGVAVLDLATPAFEALGPFMAATVSVRLAG